jgi:hypothetical protein
MIDGTEGSTLECIFYFIALFNHSVAGKSFNGLCASRGEG